jgi:tetratricopeptide (TPR) repeat protein
MRSWPLTASPSVVALLCAVLTAACSRPPATAPPIAARPIGESIPDLVRAARPAPPVILVGLDGADWGLLDQYMQQGMMPTLQRLVREGVAGTVDTIQPPLSPLVWTTMMTGVDPTAHRILDFVRFNSSSGQKEPITSDERKAPALWNMETWAGRTVGVFGLWATYPAEPVHGVMVSDRLFTFLFKEASAPQGIVFPQADETWARSTVERTRQAINLAALRAYLPSLSEAEYAAAAGAEDPYAHPVSALQRILIETQVYDELARDWIARAAPDLAIVYIQGTDSIGHTFAPFAPPRQPTIDPADYERYHDVPRKYFAKIDGLLEAYRQIAERRGGVLMLASDHGFTWGDDRPPRLSSNAQATAAKWHRKQGLYVLWGKGIAPRGRDAAATGVVGQVCPTVLALTGLPLMQGSTGEPLPGTPPGSAAPPTDYQSLFHPVTAAAPATATRAVDAQELAKLRSLGYVGSAESATSGLSTTRSAGSYNNEGLVLKSQGKKAEAVTAFERAIITDPNLASALWNLSDLLFERPATFDRSDALLVHAYGAGLPEGTKFVVGRAIGYQRSGQIDRSVRLLEAAGRERANDPEIWLFLGRYQVDAGRCPEAAENFERAIQLAPRNAAAFASLGLARLCAGDQAAARRALRHSLELDPTQTEVREYLRKLGTS